METNEILALLCVGTLVMGNLGLFLSFRRRGEDGSNYTGFEAMSRFANTARDPFGKEQRQLKELSDRVKELKPDETKNGGDK